MIFSAAAVAGDAFESRATPPMAAEDVAVSRRVVVLTRSPAAAAAARAKIPAGSKVIVKQGPLFVVELDHPVRDSDLDGLSRVSGVVHVERDEMLDPDAGQTNACETPPGVPTEVKGWEAVACQLNLANCPVTEICAENGRSKLWAQERVGADLMAAELKRIGVERDHTKVAVVDSGFDLGPNRAHMANPSFEVRKGVEIAGPPDQDTSGHGTMVTGLIGGADGVGVAPDARLTFYRVTESSRPGRAPRGNIKASILRACDEGNEVINDSWGGIGDESGQVPDEKKDAAFLGYLADHGCLVVKSAGNKGFKSRQGANDPDDAYLRVAATTPYSGMAGFSTAGEIAAPGAGVFSLKSSVASSAPGDTGKRCGRSPGTFVNGTSFAAPITAGIAAEVIGVLKKKGAWTGLAPRDRIKLLNRILIASQVDGTVNGLRAVLIAERWAGPIPEMTRLAGLLSDPPMAECKGANAICRSSTSCDALRGCYQANRRVSFLCPSQDPGLLADLFEVARQTQNFDGAGVWLDRLRRVPGVDRMKVATASESLWGDLRKSWESRGSGNPESNLERNLDFDAATVVLPPYLDARSAAKDGRAVDSAARALLSSRELYRRLARPPGHGSEQNLEESEAILRIAAAKLPPGAFRAIISEWILRSRDEPQTYRETPALARVLNAMIEDPAFAASRNDFLRLEGVLFERLNAEIILPGGPNDAIYLEAMMSRNRARLLAFFAAALGRRNLRALGAAQLVYLFESSSQIPPARLRELCSLARNAIKMDARWAASKPALARLTALLDEKCR